MASVEDPTLQRWRLLIQGIVQGVGFRPFVYGQARSHGLGGFVLNDSRGVTIEIEGPCQQLEAFQQALCDKLPPLARIDTLTIEQIPPRHETQFVIAHSQANSERQALISPDTAICADCLHDLFDPGDRRYRYPFINCTNCGPRFTIIQNVPYDRAQTTMRIFTMCTACQAEYDDPGNRRFHAQPNACPLCGPHVSLLDRSGQPVEADDPIDAAARQLHAGAILGVKGLGGYHLACDACNSEVVARLRKRKHREAKPFALMVPDLETARQLCMVNAAEAELLQSYRRPIVLLQQQPNGPIADAVAPAHTTLGIMLPYTPLHHLLLHSFAQYSSHSGQDGQQRPAVLVMTSGNLSDEPIAYRDDDALERLLSIADGLLLHNRAIHMRCDDSVARVVGKETQFLRRSRGYTPEPIVLGSSCPLPLLACGGHLKNTFCLGKGRQAFLSQHIGDLENLETLRSFRDGIEHHKGLFGIAPQAVAYDMHPEYLATKYALDTDLPHKIAVQHHHAHIASVLAEHQLAGPVIGIAADGTGYGSDGAIWGCEILAADLTEYTRLAHLAYVPLPGGEQAVRQPWRMAAVHLSQAYGDDFMKLPISAVQQLNVRQWHTLTQIIARGINTPPTSSLGRLFDAVAALLSIQRQVLYEGQAAIELEAMAAGETSPTESYPFTLHSGQPALLDVRPLIRAIVEDLMRGVPLPHISTRFHRSIALLLAAACEYAREQTHISTVALSGGVFQNRLLLTMLLSTLQKRAFDVYTNRLVPPNDGGLSLGQLAVAAARLQRCM